MRDDITTSFKLFWSCCHDGRPPRQIRNRTHEHGQGKRDSK
jgi:hypothetical protein